MAKKSMFFQHDYNSRHDPKIVGLINIHGMAGVGVWWMLIEIMHEQGGKIEKFPKLYQSLASEMKQNEATLEAMIRCFVDDLHLLKETPTHIWSERVLRNIEFVESKRLQKVNAGRLGGIESGKKRKQNEAPLKQNEANEAYNSIVNNSKEKEIKEKRGVFTPPTIQQVIEFFNGDILEANKFFNHYESNGWVQNKGKKIVDWKAAGRGWQLRKNEYAAQTKVEVTGL